MKPLYILFACCLAISSRGQYADPNFAKPSSGYGADGPHTVGTISFANPNYPAKDIEIYHPSDISTKVPTIFYGHAYGGNVSANISGLLNFVAMKGYAIVFVPYQTLGVSIYDRYDNLLAGFRKAARDHPAIIDTTRVGFMGHSFGGGASFGNAYQAFTVNSWGQNGRFIYALAQWYSYNISQAELQSFPADTKLLTEVFNDDVTNDHRMAVDIFNTISISPAEKDFILLKSDTIAGYTYLADHVVPNTSAAFDALDYYAYYRLLDALCDYTFNGSLAGKNVALGNGSAAQVSMPTGLKSLVQTDSPVIVYPENKYEFPCSDTQNLRVAYCPVSLGFKAAELSSSAGFLVFPNPASGQASVQLPLSVQQKELSIYDALGQLVASIPLFNRNVVTLDVSAFTKGIYTLANGELKTKLVVD